MSPIRIHLGHMPEMLRTIIDDLLAQEADLVVVGISGAGEDPLINARKGEVDMLITSEVGEADAPCLHAVLSGPLSILTIAKDGGDATAVSLAPWPVAFDPSVRSSFANAVRRVAARDDDAAVS